MKDKIVTLREPHLDGEEALYVRAYVSTLNHSSAYKALNPTCTYNSINNKYSKRSNIQFHINKILQLRLETLSLTPEIVLSLLYKEATYEGEFSSHGARITAITTLGKHLGLFHDKPDDSKQITYNIINYKDPNETTTNLEKLEENILEVESNIEGVEVINYKEKEDGS